MLNSSYDGEIEQWDMIDKYSMNVIYTASVDIRRRMSAKKRSFDFVEFDTDLVGEQDIYPSEYVISDNSGHCCNVKNEWLYEAMLFLDDKLKEVLILIIKKRYCKDIKRFRENYYKLEKQSF